MAPWNNFVNYFSGGTKAREEQETLALYDTVASLIQRSVYGAERRTDFVTELLRDACEEAGVVPVDHLTDAIGRLIDDIIDSDGLFGELPPRSVVTRLSTQEAVRLRSELRRRETFLRHHERYGPLWRHKLRVTIAGLLEYLPPTAFKSAWLETEADDALPGAQSALIDLMDEPNEAIERLLITFCDEETVEAGLFEPLREQFMRRVLFASGIEWEERHQSRRAFVLPLESRERQPARIAELYCAGTPFGSFFATELPFVIPFPARFEHTHILGGSGHGKTQCLQLAIVRDLVESAADQRSVVVIDSQGDLIETISHLAMLAPDDPSGLADRVMLIDPSDVEYPVALNMFDVNREEMDSLPLLERERILNATIDLYEYFFGALLGAELTARQGIIFKYLARLLLEIPDATIHTFRQLMENGEPFRPYMEQLPPTARAFFRERFFDRSFSETKKQVLTRLWGVLSNSTFDRMFSHPRSKLDLYAALQDGKIVLLNTAKELLKEDGASILGRFFIALIAQAALRRASIPPHERTPSFVYTDEAADYFDDRIGHLLTQARKYKVGMTLAHQNLDQLAPSLRASILANTSIKLAGGVSNKDASLMASEMHTDAGFIQSQRKRQHHTSFACYVRNVTPRAQSIAIPLGAVEALPRMEDEEFAELRARSREAYCVPLDEVPEPPGFPEPAAEPQPEPIETVAPEERVSEPLPETKKPKAEEHHEPTPARTSRPLPPRAKTAQAVKEATRPLGRGGREHTYLQNLIKEFAIAQGFHAVIEESVLDGAGSVDVSLSLNNRKIACEISVTTGRDHELQNIEKCLAADYADVLFVSADARHLKAMEVLTKERLEEEHHGKVHFCDPEAALAFIEAAAGTGASQETVRGYRETVKRATLDPDEAARRRSAVAAVIARSLQTPND